MTNTERLAAVFRKAALLVSSCSSRLSSCECLSVYDLAEKAIIAMNDLPEKAIPLVDLPPLSVKEQFMLAQRTFEFLDSLGMKDSPEWNVSPEHAIHLFELAALLCEEYEGEPLPAVDPFSVLRSVPSMTSLRAYQAVEILNKYFDLVPKNSPRSS